MVAEVYAGIGAFKTMFDMAKALKEMDTANARNMAVINLQERILTAQSAYADLASRVGELEEQVRSFETWDRDKQRYELHELKPGKFVYRLKDGAEPAEPPHEICAKCYEDGKRSVLQQERVHAPKGGMQEYVTCHRCRSQINITYG